MKVLRKLFNCIIIRFLLDGFACCEAQGMDLAKHVYNGIRILINGQVLKPNKVTCIEIAYNLTPFLLMIIFWPEMFWTLPG